MTDPCDNCKKVQDCTARCYPKKDYDRSKKNKKRRETHGKMQGMRRPDYLEENQGR